MTKAVRSVRTVTIALWVVATGTMLVPPAAATPVSKLTQTPRLALDEPYALKVRSEMGLTSDINYIRRVAVSPDSSNAIMGTPLTAEERADIAGRQILNQWVGTIQEAAKREPNYAGVWIDQKAGGVLRIAVAGPLARNSYDRLRQELPTSDRVTFVQAKYALTQLRAAYSAVSKALVAHSPETSNVVSAAVSVPNNSVEVAVSLAAPSAEVSQLRSRYPDPVTVMPVSGEGFSPQSGRDMPTGRVYAGAWTNNSLTGPCTINYGAALNSIGQWYAATAGHCGSSGASVGTFYQGRYFGTKIGESHQNKYRGGAAASGNCDCQVVGPMAPSGQAGRDLLIDNNRLYNLTHTGGKSEQAPGTYVCVSGAESYDSNGGHIVCGYVVADEVSIPYQDGSGFVLTDATTASVRTSNGDSGAPMNGGSAMLGLLSAYSPGLQQGAYTKVYNVELRTGVRYQY